MIDAEREVKKICEDIKNLKIQGARNVAIASIEAFDLKMKSPKTKDKETFFSEMLELGNRFAELRPTEPMLINLLRRFTKKISEGKNIGEMKEIFKKTKSEFEISLKENIEKISGYGSNLIKDGSTVLTHCHSSTAESAIVSAFQTKNIKVICTETRPRFQGRITAQKLSKAGIGVTMIVDSAIGSVMHDVDIVIVGADVITTSGDLINKIGTSTVAEIAEENRIPFYSAAELWKYDPMTKFGVERHIEMRDRSELFSDLKSKDLKKFDNINVLNPSFDLTSNKYIKGYITEEGIIPPQNIADVAERVLEI